MVLLPPAKVVFLQGGKAASAREEVFDALHLICSIPTTPGPHGAPLLSSRRFCPGDTLARPRLAAAGMGDHGGVQFTARAWTPRRRLYLFCWFGPSLT